MRAGSFEAGQDVIIDARNWEFFFLDPFVPVRYAVLEVAADGCEYRYKRVPVTTKKVPFHLEAAAAKVVSA